jgi:hypothetical protein
LEMGLLYRLELRSGSSAEVALAVEFTAPAGG